MEECAHWPKEATRNTPAPLASQMVSQNKCMHRSSQRVMHSRSRNCTEPIGKMYIQEEQ